MKQTIGQSQFMDAFRGDRKDQFSYEARKALFDYLEEYEKDTDTEVELDVVALCCEYCEYENLDAFIKDYGEEYKTMDVVRDATTVIDIDGTAFIIQQF